MISAAVSCVSPVIECTRIQQSENCEQPRENSHKKRTYIRFLMSIML